jgi:hypothetical protein
MLVKTENLLRVTLTPFPLQSGHDGIFNLTNGVHFWLMQICHQKNKELMFNKYF